MVHFESCFWEVCVSLIMSCCFLLDTMNRTFAWPTNHVSIICSQLLLCISSAVSYTFQPHCWINKCHRLLQSGTYPINFATWKTIWNEINSRDVQTTSMVCYATTAHFNTASIFLFNYFFLPVPTGFASVLLTTTYSNLILQSQAIPSGLQETLGVQLILPISSNVIHYLSIPIHLIIIHSYSP